ncbi:hypothetical protein GCWU000325_01793 [Alloprevotella tannerae ATCC 51259]|uniref:Uncharacterized protein n=1 Tax=Alloprevotella tannerae ATCC 51259 TaxID=626522 RepID=C9LHT9_9BACT|nr:hypothetical protein GCWU000325_01793 [Alloprevotella tannerae ATCC 51259]
MLFSLNEYQKHHFFLCAHTHQSVLRQTRLTILLIFFFYRQVRASHSASATIQ